MENEYLDALKKSALGYEYIEKQEIFEETNTSKKKRIVQIHRQVPPNPQAIQILLELEQQDTNDIIKTLDKTKK